MSSSKDGKREELEEVDLSSLLDLQDAREEGESKRASRVILLSSGCLFVLVVFFCVVTASNRRKVDGLIQNLEESRHELEPVGGKDPFAKAYDDMMDKLGSRSTDIDHATRSLGTDPSTVKEDGMDPEMKQMMGGEGRTAGERQRAVEGLAHLAGSQLPKPNGQERVSAETTEPVAPTTPVAPVENDAPKPDSEM